MTSWTFFRIWSHAVFAETLCITSRMIGIRLFLSIVSIAWKSMSPNRSRHRQMQNGKSVTLDMSGYAKGVYFVRVDDGEKVVMKKMVKD